MSTVAEEITRISGCREDIKTAIAAKGVTVPTGAKLADCPALIASITGGGGPSVPSSFVNTGFSATGAWTYYRPFTATQNIVPQYATASAEATLTTESNTKANIAFKLTDTSVFPLDNTPANLVIRGQYQSWGTPPDTGIVNGYIVNGYDDPVYTAIGTYMTYKNGTNFTATASFTANTGSFPYYIEFDSMKSYSATAQNPATAITYTKTGEDKAYPQYPDSTEGVMTASISGNEGWSIYAPKSVRMLKTGSYGATYNDGPDTSVSIPTDTANVTAFIGGELRSFITYATLYTGVADTGYTYSYGEVTSGYYGYTGI